MKQDKVKFIKKSTTFLLILICLILLVNTVYTKLILEKKMIYRTELVYKEYLSSLTINEINFLFLGDCHTNFAANPRYIKNSFNFAGRGESYVESYFKLKRILENDKVKVNNIILQVDLNTFNSNDKEIPSNNLWFNLNNKERLSNNLWYYSQFTNYKELKKVLNENIFELWLRASLPMIGNGEEFKFLIVKPRLMESYLGWIKIDRNLPKLNMTKYIMETKGSEFIFKNQKQLNEQNFKYFLKTIELAKENNIQVIIIKYPILKEYNEFLIKSKVIKEDYYDMIFKRMDGEYFVLDYSSLFFNNSDYFFDPFHINYHGAEQLSKQVYEDLKKLNLTDNGTKKELYNL